MADIYANNILCWKFKSKKLIFEYWNERTLSIIPDIIIPMEESLVDYLSKKDSITIKINNKLIEKLRILYNDIKNYCDP